MSRKAKNKTKAWRKDFEMHSLPQEVQSTTEEGEIIKSVVEVPYILKGRMLRNYRLQGGNMKPLASNLLINLISNAGFATINDDNLDLNIPEDIFEATKVETATV